MATSDFSWFKILSFFGVGLLTFACFVVIAGGITLCTKGEPFNGAFTIVAGLLLGAAAVWVYRNYQKKDAASKSLGEFKIKDKQNKK